MREWGESPLSRQPVVNAVNMEQVETRQTAHFLPCLEVWEKDHFSLKKKIFVRIN